MSWQLYLAMVLIWLSVSCLNTVIEELLRCRQP